MNKIINFVKRYIIALHPLKNKKCCICNRNVSNFIAYKGGWKKAPKLMKALNVIGSDLDNFSCPICYSHDRERHQWLYWQSVNLVEKMHNASILHFAPETHLAKKIKNLKFKIYIKADLHPTSKDIKKIDLLAMPFSNNIFDIVIANHILEHVNDLQQALSEIHRVLKPNGWAILQTPYSSCLQQTWEDQGIQTVCQRLIAYGQEDHVRLFGKDIFTIIEKAGFVSHIGDHIDLLKNIDSKVYGVNNKEPFMLFRKLG